MFLVLIVFVLPLIVTLYVVSPVCSATSCGPVQGLESFGDRPIFVCGIRIMTRSPASYWLIFRLIVFCLSLVCCCCVFTTASLCAFVICCADCSASCCSEEYRCQIGRAHV